MTINVLVVDDSGFFRRRLTELINATQDLNVIGAAENGEQAIEMNNRLRPDVITMDYEMPVMNGLCAVREIMATQPVPILMFSSLTHEGAKITLDCLAAGAMDFLPKQFEEIAKGTDEVKKTVADAIINVASSNYKASTQIQEMDTSKEMTAINLEKPATFDKPSSFNKPEVVFSTPKIKNNKNRLGQKKIDATQLIIIGTSTGGPIALQQVLIDLPATYTKPIIIVQHMPSNFTKAFAGRLNDLCNITVKEAEDGDMIKPGLALVAPGGKQVMLSHTGAIKVVDGDDRITYKPSVDVTFGSAANVYPDGVLGVVLTGMGTDGREGARLLKQSGSSVWAQDEESSVIYGMPMAVAKAGLADETHNLKSLSLRLQEIG